MKKKILIILGILIAVLAIANPSRSSFASYLHRSGNTQIGRDANYFIFSIYSIGVYNSPPRARYVGVSGNFYRLD